MKGILSIVPLSLIVLSMLLMFTSWMAKANDLLVEEWRTDLEGNGPMIIDDVDDDSINEIIGGEFVGEDRVGRVSTYHGYVYLIDTSTYTKEWQSEDVGIVRKIVISDLTGDEVKEIVVFSLKRMEHDWGHWDGYLYVFDGQSREQKWKSDNIGGRGGDLAVADLDGDGIKEIISGACYDYTPPPIYGHVYVFNGDDFMQRRKISGIGQPTCIVVDDPDMDDVKEIIVGTLVADSGINYEGYVHIFNGIDFTQEWKSSNISPRRILVNDVDDDGSREIIAGTHWQRGDLPHTGYIHVFDGATHGQEWQSSLLKGAAYRVDIYDVDDDDTKEIIVGTSENWRHGSDGHLHIFDGITHAQELDEEIGNVFGLGVGDVDADNTKEIVTASSFSLTGEPGYLRVFHGQSKTLEWQSEDISPQQVLYIARSIVVTDVDKDGYVEIVAVGAKPEKYTLYVFGLGAPARTFIDIHPDTLNLRSKGKWITAYVELPESYDVNDINVTTVILNGTIPAEVHPVAIGDYDDDGIPDLMVKFNRTDVISYILDNVNMTKLFEERFMTVTLTVTGYLNDDTPFHGSDIIKILYTPRGVGKGRYVFAV
jgi:hypothetical protein